MIGRRATAELKGSADAALLGYVREVAENLPNRTEALVDKLFTLECVARAGDPLEWLARQLRRARRDTELALEEGWESDLPHLMILCQAVSTAEATNEHVPRDWVERIPSTLDGLLRRRTRFGLGSDLGLLATVFRGLAAADLRPPAALVDVVESLAPYDGRVGTVELVEALMRHRDLRPQAEALAHAAASTAAEAQTTAVGLWWLSLQSRRLSVDLGFLPKEDELVKKAITQPAPVHPRSAAMALEAAATAVGSMILGPSEVVLRAGRAEGALRATERYVWRGGFSIAVCSLALLNLTSWAPAIERFLGRKTAHVDYVILATALFATLLWVVLRVLSSSLRAFGRRPDVSLPPWVEVLLPLIAGAVAAVLFAPTSAP